MASSKAESPVSATCRSTRSITRCCHPHCDVDSRHLTGISQKVGPRNDDADDIGTRRGAGLVRRSHLKESQLASLQILGSAVSVRLSLPVFHAKLQGRRGRPMSA